jgi:LL-diaminopimelate aminotransferase
MAATVAGEQKPLHPLWNRRMTTKFNGVGYIVQRGAEALYSEAGKAEVRELVTHYMENAKILREATASAGLGTWGGVNAPYVWVAAPSGLTSWDVFDRMLHDAHVVITPGSGFGSAGEGYFRISAFNSRENVEEVARRINSIRW